VRPTRRQAIQAAALSVAAAASPALAATDDDEKKRAEAALAAALRLEQTAVVAYEAIANSGRLSGRATTLMRAFLDDDGQHADQLVSALEAMGVKPPIPPRRATIPGLARVRSDVAAADFAIELELRAVGAYSEAVRNLSDPNLLRVVAGAMGTDGQHLVVLRQLARRNPVPHAFERGIRP
jgi:rubrerythrin